jgi:hypothetical protein
LSTVEGNVFLVALDDASVGFTNDRPSAANRHSPSVRSGRVIPLTQWIWDPGSHTLHAYSAEFLDEHTRHALVVTNSVRSTNGAPIAPAAEFTGRAATLSRSSRAEDRSYAQALALAESASRLTGLKTAQIAALSLFTTQSFTYLREKVASQLLAAAPPAAADFNIGPGGSRAIFPFDAIQTLTHHQHTRVAGPLVASDVSLVGSRFVNGSVGRLAYGRFAAPDYMIHPGEYIPPLTARGGAPRSHGTNTLYFSLALPSGQMPAEGWPVVVFGIGGNGNRIGTFAEIAAIPASYGLAVVAIENVVHGFGPLSSVTISPRDGAQVTIPAP